MDVNTAIEIATASGGIYHWEEKLKLHAVYFDYGGLYFTVKELANMQVMQYEAYMQHINQQEAYLAEHYGGPTKH